MNNAAPEAEGSRGAFLLDSTVAGAGPRGFDALRHVWETQIGDVFRLPTFSPTTIGDLRVKGRAAKVRDVRFADVRSASALAGTPGDDHDAAVMYVVRRGTWTLDDPPDRDEHTVSAGQFRLRHFERPYAFETAPHTTTKILALPAARLSPVLGNRIITGPADSAEVRLLVAHTNMVHATIDELGPAGVHAAHSTLIELAKAVVRRRFDDTEPQLAPALAQAAKDLADGHLADPELSPAMLARQLNVSVRTLQRAFAATGESVGAYIRQRRLEEARLALTAPSRRLSVSELAAHWHFADSSHFIRAFKKQYGRTPTDYASSTRPAGG
ncbi:helix-turn-helix domain-containing protein [Streptomyces sp. NL15-2K]|uniref:helix-turn-helix domain-containing protein n=1 Tax=Streptomyces sp. NL15-2K TaxID=376149 RepID=UPI000F55C620|nr:MULTISPECIES: helix-turn-helix domain-containing protein [Actinomycetes]WKX11291.1 helix-turn-helix domain-containing protein [Kutzneria buriramensis]GCB47292.1 araC family transcriptional regulator [Streptomyces sp. NL15-2K]